MLAQAPDELERLYHALGELLAVVHATPPLSDHPALLLAERARHALGMLPTLKLVPDLCRLLQASLEHAAWRVQPTTLAHGDVGLHNLLWNGQITALLDWEWAGWGNGLLDLAWLYWTMRWRQLPPPLWETFRAGYGAGPALAHDIAPEAMQALVLGQIAGILVRVQNQPQLWHEWLRRLQWTHTLAFPGG
jgi:aminoglycoside phosphotransferase (APT) family kinase protein